MKTRLLMSILPLVVMASAPAFENRSVSANDVSVAVRHFVSDGWQVAATQNFHIHHRGAVSVKRLQQLADHLETRRHTIGTTWLGSEFASHWSVTCDVFLHQTDAQYEQHSRMPAETVGYARLKVGRGKVWLRRLDLRWQTEGQKTFDVASHELTHIVLAERFCWRQIPRWADEGIAIASETGERPERLSRVLLDAAEAGRLFSIRELLTAHSYPGDRQMADLFYAQSASLVKYLAETHSYEHVLRLADASTTHEVTSAISATTTARDATYLGQRWEAWLRSNQGADSVLVARDE